MHPVPFRHLLPDVERRHLLALLAGLACGSKGASAASLPELIARVKRSVVAVGSYGLMGTRASASARRASRWPTACMCSPMRTWCRPRRPGRIDRSIAVQVWLGDDQWQLRSARLLGRDLALLAIDGPALPALKLAAQDAVEGAAIALMGFPIGNALGQVHTTHRGIVSAWTSIATPAGGSAGLNPGALRQLRDGAFKVTQLDAIAYPGNSGGPVLDIETAEVVGVLQGGVIKGTKEAALSAPTGITYAVPASTAAALLAEHRR